MYCKHCGKRSLSISALYCTSCGKKLVVAEGEKKKKKHKEFVASISTKRTNNLPPKTNVKKNKHPEKVKIYVSCLNNVKGLLKQVTGSRTPVEVSETADYSDTKFVAFEKLHRYVPELAEFNLEEIDLVYKSGNIAFYIPGTQIPFTLKSYKEDLGCKYSQILLYLKPKEEEIDQVQEEDKQKDPALEQILNEEEEDLKDNLHYKYNFSVFVQGNFFPLLYYHYILVNLNFVEVYESLFRDQSRLHEEHK